MANKLKKNIVSRGFGAPSPREGRDGDLAVRFVKGQGLFLFYKWANKWYSNRLSLYKNKTNELKDPVRIPIKTPSKVGELGLKGNKAYLLRNSLTEILQNIIKESEIKNEPKVKKVSNK